MGQIVGIRVKRSHGGVMEPRQAGRLVAGRGLEGNATQGGRRQVTIMSIAHWRQLTAHLPGPPDPAIRRANLLVDGIDLENSRGRILVLGEARVRIFGETRPCHQMEEACAGLLAALSPPWGGGAFGEVLADGDIQVGGEVTWEPVATPRLTHDQHRAGDAVTARKTPSPATT